MGARVTVCVPTYNRADLLKECLDSILNQTFSSFNLFVVDNCSTDNTSEVVSAVRDTRLRYIRNSENLGMVGNWNRCLEIALEEDAPYVAIYHADDWYYPTILESEVKFLDQHPRVGLVQTALTFYNAEDGRSASGAIYETDRVLDLFETLKGSLKYGLCGTPSVLAKKDAYRQAGLFDPSYRIVADMDMWLRILDHYDLGYIAEPLCRYRLHSGQESNSAEFELTHREWRDIYVRTAGRLAFNRLDFDEKKFIESMDFMHAKSVLSSMARGALIRGDYETFYRACTVAERLSNHGIVRLERAILGLCSNSFGRWILRTALQLKDCMSSALRGGIRYLSP